MSNLTEPLGAAVLHEGDDHAVPTDRRPVAGDVRPPIMGGPSPRTNGLAQHLVARLDRAVSTGDLGTLAALRRGASGPGRLLLLGRLIGDWGRADADALLLVAAVYARAHRGLDHPVSGKLGFGSVVGRAVRADPAIAAGIERRFVTLVSGDPTDIDHLLVRVCDQLRGTPAFAELDWERFARDVLGAGHPDRYVQTRWARDYVRERDVGSGTRDGGRDPDGAPPLGDDPDEETA